MKLLEELAKNKYNLLLIIKEWLSIHDVGALLIFCYGRNARYPVLFANDEHDIVTRFIKNAKFSDYKWLLRKSIKDRCFNAIYEEPKIKHELLRQLTSPEADIQDRHRVLRFMNQQSFTSSSVEANKALEKPIDLLNFSLCSTLLPPARIGKLMEIFDQWLKKSGNSGKYGELDSVVIALTFLVYKLEREHAQSMIACLWKKIDAACVPGEKFSWLSPHMFRSFCMLVVEFEVQSIAELIKWWIRRYREFAKMNINQVMQDIFSEFRADFQIKDVFNVILIRLDDPYGPIQHAAIEVAKLFWIYFEKEQRIRIFEAVLTIKNHPCFNTLRKDAINAIAVFVVSFKNEQCGDEQCNQAFEAIFTMLKDPESSGGAMEAAAIVWPYLEEKQRDQAFQAVLMVVVEEYCSNSVREAAIEAMRIFWSDLNKAQRERAFQVVFTTLQNRYPSVRSTAVRAIDRFWPDLEIAQCNLALQAVRAIAGSSFSNVRVEVSKFFSPRWFHFEEEERKQLVNRWVLSLEYDNSDHAAGYIRFDTQIRQIDSLWLWFDEAQRLKVIEHVLICLSCKRYNDFSGMLRSVDILWFNLNEKQRYRAFKAVFRVQSWPYVCSAVRAQAQATASLLIFRMAEDNLPKTVHILLHYLNQESMCARMKAYEMLEEIIWRNPEYNYEFDDVQDDLVRTCLMDTVREVKNIQKLLPETPHKRSISEEHENVEAPAGGGKRFKI